MRGRTWRIVAVQATLSIAAIVVVYLTLLRTDGSQPLYDVEAPGTIDGRQELPIAEPADRGGRQRRVAESDPPDAPAARPSVLVASASARLDEGAARDPGSPSSDQYASTVGQIRARVSAAAE